MHLMIYDIEGHIDHCKKSPFTCLDWQSSRAYIKKPMSAIWKVTALQPNYFFSARRSVKDYLEDLNKGVVSYRKYEFLGENVNQVKNYKKMTNKNKFEFAYHIMKFCMLNFLKMHNKENKDYGGKLAEEYFRIFPLNAKTHIKTFRKIREMKTANKYEVWGNGNKQLLARFLNDFQEQFKTLFDEEVTRLIFMRHQKTPMNKPGVFVGQRSNPEIMQIEDGELENLRSLISKKIFAAAFCSPSTRCLQTIDSLKKMIKIDQTIIDDLLKEINYGTCDGKDYEYLKMNHPEIIHQWEKGADPMFPKGENVQDVLRRLEKFMSKLQYSKGKTYIICTHNVVLRCLIGSQLNIPKQEWFKIVPKYLDPIEVIMTKDRKFFINLRPEQAEQALSKVKMGEN